jgi:diguanylate cyclase
MSICDAFDAMINDRPYRAGVSANEAGATLLAGAGTQWDPGLVDLFLAEMPLIERMGAA